MKKFRLGNPSTKECPRCGGETVIESGPMPSIKTRRCDSLVETSPSQPLDACTWEEDIYSNGKPVNQ